MKIRMTNAPTTELPRDIFPGREELEAAIGIDDLCAEINRRHNEELDRIAASVLTRLDRLAFTR